MHYILFSLIITFFCSFSVHAENENKSHTNTGYSGWPIKSFLNAWSKENLPQGVRFYAKDWLRWSEWRYFEPAAGGGDPDYGYFSNRLRFGLKAKRKKWSADASFQYVKQFSLPDDATGGLGLGSVYFGQSKSADPSSLYIKYLNVGLLDIANLGVDFSIGRFDYGNGVEILSRNNKIDWLKKVRIDSRVLGGFGWSIYQRSFDGAKISWNHELGHLNVAAFRPTQGGFESNANDHISQINVLSSAYTFKPNKILPNSEIQLFHYYFDDERKVPNRIDNSGLTSPTGTQDIAIHSLGGHVVGYRPYANGIADYLVWGMYQTGDWFEQDHDAYGVAIELGYQFTHIAWKPWIRIGTYRGSGDDDASDNTHGTFYQMLPTVRKYAFTTSYNLMNNTDHFIQLLLTPHPKLKIRTDLHRVSLTESTDRWYGGAGATQASGTVQGFAGRLSGGDDNLLTSLEFTAKYQITDAINLHGFYGHVFGDEVVKNNFAGGQDFDFFFLELTVNF